MMNMNTNIQFRRFHRGLKREGACERDLFIKSSKRTINGSCIVLLLNSLQHKHTIIRVKHTNRHIFLIINHTKINVQACLAKEMENLWQPLALDLRPRLHDAGRI